MKQQLAIGILIVGFFCGGVSFAANDCGLITNPSDVTDPNAYLNLTTKFKDANIEGVMPSAAISQALVNMKKACCMSREVGKNKEERKKNCDGFADAKNYPDSVYLYDHLLDVAMRRLDGNKDLAYGLSVDQAGKTWRDFITQAAQDENGTITAKIILDTYQKTRTRSKLSTDGRNTNGKTLRKNLEDYNSSLTLADKYNNICGIVQSIYTTIAGSDSSISETTQNKCNAMVSQRISDEYIYTKTIIIKKSNELLHSSLQAYTSKYFVQEKMMTLLALVNKVKSLFSTMVTQAAVSKTCSE